MQNVSALQGYFFVKSLVNVSVPQGKIFYIKTNYSKEGVDFLKI